MFVNIVFLISLGVSITINNNFESDQMITSLTVMFMESRIGVNVTSEEDQNNLAISVILPPDLKVGFSDEYTYTQLKMIISLDFIRYWDSFKCWIWWL